MCFEIVREAYRSVLVIKFVRCKCCIVIKLLVITVLVIKFVRCKCCILIKFVRCKCCRLDLGDAPYAATFHIDPKNRPILWVWLRDAPPETVAPRDYCGCLGVPRLVSYLPSVHLLHQQPLPELANLRGRQVWQAENLALADGLTAVPIEGGQLAHLDCELTLLRCEITLSRRSITLSRSVLFRCKALLAGREPGTRRRVDGGADVD